MWRRPYAVTKRRPSCDPRPRENHERAQKTGIEKQDHTLFRVVDFPTHERAIERQCGISYTVRGKSGKGEHTTFALPEEQHLNGGPLAAAGGAVLLELFVDLVTDTSGLCFFAEADVACIGRFVRGRSDSGSEWIVVETNHEWRRGGAAKRGMGREETRRMGEEMKQGWRERDREGETKLCVLRVECGLTFDARPTQYHTIILANALPRK